MMIDWLSDDDDDKISPPPLLTPERLERLDLLSKQHAILEIMAEGTIYQRVKLAQWRLYWWATGNDLYHYGRTKTPGG